VLFNGGIGRCAAFLSYGHFALIRSCSDRFGRGLRRGWYGGLHNAAPLNDVVPAGSLALLFRRWSRPRRFRRCWSAGCIFRLTALRLPPLHKHRLGFFPL
jgi:hypothetical protein